MKMGKNVRRLMLEQGLSVAELSSRSGVPAKTLYHWLGGQKPHNIEQIFKICEVLEVSVESLFERQLPRPRNIPSLDFRKIAEDLHIGTYEVVLRPTSKKTLNDP
ncbi:MAG: helix-turn-helix transcriptional regulator [Bdellovibrio sp.]